MNSGSSGQIKQFVDKALLSTGLVLTRSFALDGTWHSGAASAVYVHFNGHFLAVTCRHVEAKSDIWYVDAPAIAPTRAGLASLPASSPSWPLAVWTAADIAIFKADPNQVKANKREFFDLSTQRVLSRDTLKPPVSAIITGIWAAESQYEKARDALLFDPFPYTAKGEIIEVGEHEITARFEENEVVVWDEAERARAKKIIPEGASRNLNGMSGSGLWLPMKDGSVTLAGILKGPKTKVGDPDIVFTPIWTLARRLQALFPKKVV